MKISMYILITLALSTQSLFASLDHESPKVPGKVTSGKETGISRGKKSDKCKDKDQDDLTAKEKAECEKRLENQDPIFNPDYNSDPEMPSPIGGVSGGTNRGLGTVIASIIGKGNRGTNQKTLENYNIDNIHQGTKELVITVDDGPTPGVTNLILDALAKYHAQAVFFVIGEKAKRHPELLARMQREGHIVGNHSLTHANLGHVPFWKRKKVVRKEILGNHEIIKNYATNSPHFYFRAPYGSWNKHAAKVINSTEVGKNYIGPVLWDIGGEMDTQNFTEAADWACWSKHVTVEQCLLGYKNRTERTKGGVVLFHSLKHQSAQLIEAFLKEYTSRPDWRFISIDEIQF